VLVVLARSFCLTPDLFGPGIRSALATLFINRVIDRCPNLEMVMARIITTVMFNGAPVNQSRAESKFFGSFMVI
jgi:hypothetical protein